MFGRPKCPAAHTTRWPDPPRWAGIPRFWIAPHLQRSVLGFHGSRPCRWCLSSSNWMPRHPVDDACPPTACSAGRVPVVAALLCMLATTVLLSWHSSSSKSPTPGLTERLVRKIASATWCAILLVKDSSSSEPLSMAENVVHWLSVSPSLSVKDVHSRTPSLLFLPVIRCSFRASSGERCKISSAACYVPWENDGSPEICCTTRCKVLDPARVIPALWTASRRSLRFVRSSAVRGWLIATRALPLVIGLCVSSLSLDDIHSTIHSWSCTSSRSVRQVL